MATIRIKRRKVGAGAVAGAPSGLKNAELAFNEVNDTLFYGKGEDGSGNATSIVPIAGDGVVWTGTQTFGNVVGTGRITSGDGSYAYYNTFPTDPKLLATVDYVDEAIARGSGATLIPLGANADVATTGPLTTLASDSNIAHFAPVRVSFTRPISITGINTWFNLSGLGVMDGVTLAVNDRVLILSHALAGYVGIWVVKEGAWERPADASSPAHFVCGKKVTVQSGTARGGNTYIVPSNAQAATNNDFNRFGSIFFANSEAPAAGYTTLYSRIVRAAGNSYTVVDGKVVVDGVTLNGFDRFLYMPGGVLGGGGANSDGAASGGTNGSGVPLVSGGIYIVDYTGVSGGGSLIRRAQDLDSSAEFVEAGTATGANAYKSRVLVLEGTTNAKKLISIGCGPDGAGFVLGTSVPTFDVYGNHNSAAQGLAGTPIIDGYQTIHADVIGGDAVVVGSSVLVKDETDATLNGLYYIPKPESPYTATNVPWIRHPLADQSGELVYGSYIRVLNGDSYKNAGFVQVTNTDPIVPGTTPIVFQSAQAALEFKPGVGLGKSDRTLYVKTASNQRIAVSEAGVDLATVTDVVTDGSVDQAYILTQVDQWGRVKSNSKETLTATELRGKVVGTPATAESGDTTGTGDLVFSIGPTLQGVTVAADYGLNFSNAAAVTAGANSQGSLALTNDINVVTVAAASPSGVTLPAATAGRRVVVVNRGANPVNVYPASGAAIDALSANASIQILANSQIEFLANSSSQWYSASGLRPSAGYSVLGTSTSATATPSDITASTDGHVLRRSGTSLGFGTVVAAGIASDAVETAKIKDANVTAAKLATDSVETAKIKDANVTAAKLATDAVETAKIKDANVTAAKLATDSVETAKIKDGAVTNAKIADSTISSGKLASMTSANLAGVISDETGYTTNAKAVFSTSPSFETSVTTSSTTFGVFDTTATTVNAFGAATTGNIGYDGTDTSTTSISTGATASTKTKTIKIGTDSAAGSTTDITIGSISGTSNVVINNKLTIGDGLGPSGKFDVAASDVGYFFRVNDDSKIKINQPLYLNTAGGGGPTLISMGAGATGAQGIDNHRILVGNIVIDSAGATVGVDTYKGAISGCVWQGDAIGPTYGGTGQSTYATGDLLYASASNTLSKLTKPASATSVLQMTSAGVPSWNAATGTGSVVFATSPTLVTPTLGTATATSINKVAITAPATAATLTIANNKTLTCNNTLTFAGTDATTMTFPAASTTVAGLSTTQTFTGANTFTNTVSVDNATLTVSDAESATVISLPPTGLISAYGISTTGDYDSTIGGTLNASTVVISGNLTVNGTTTILNVDTLQVEDKNIELGKVATPTNTTANGGGITLLGGANGDKTILWDSTNTNWTSSEHWNLVAGKTYKINNVSIVSSTVVGNTDTDWNGKIIAVAYGGTGTNNGSITGTGALTFTAGGTNTNVTLAPNGTGTVDVSSKRITSLATPTQDTDAATKAYVDSAVSTGTADGSVTTAKLANGAVTTDKIADDAVTYAKIQEMAATTVLGNATAAQANPTAIAASVDGQVLRRSGTTLGFGTIATAGIADSAVTTAKITDSNVTTAKIADSAVTAAKIADGTITSAKFAAGAICSAVDSCTLDGGNF